MTERTVFTASIRLEAELRESMRFDDLPFKAGAQLRDAFADATGTVYITYEAADAARDSLGSVVLVPTGGLVPEVEPFLRTVRATGIGTLHVYASVPE